MMAVATPAMLPVPTDAASAVVNAWNAVSTPAAPSGDRAAVARTASGNLRNWTKPSRTVRNAPAPSSTATTYGMKTASASDWIASAMANLSVFSSRLLLDF